MARTSDYSDDIPGKFRELCKQGKSLTQIANELGVLEKKLIDWTDDPRKREFKKAFDIGVQAYQAYHEELFDRMINPDNPLSFKASSAEIAAQQARLRVKFKDNWSEKQETQKIEMTHVDTRTISDLQNQIDTMLRKPSTRNYLKSKLKIVNSSKDTNENGN